LRLLNERQDVFLGYCWASGVTAAAIKRCLRRCFSFKQ
jgi:hypothetical protein